MTQSEQTDEFEPVLDEPDTQSLPQIKDELTGTLVTQTTLTEQADISEPKITSKTSATAKPAKKSKHKQIIQDVAVETTQAKVKTNTIWKFFNVAPLVKRLLFNHLLCHQNKIPLALSSRFHKLQFKFESE